MNIVSTADNQRPDVHSSNSISADRSQEQSGYNSTWTRAERAALLEFYPDSSSRTRMWPSSIHLMSFLCLAPLPWRTHHHSKHDHTEMLSTFPHFWLLTGILVAFNLIKQRVFLFLDQINHLTVEVDYVFSLFILA